MLLALLTVAFTSTAFGQELLIENVTVLSSPQRPPLEKANVLIRDGRITEICTRRLAAPPGIRRLDGHGKFLTPGLMDSHVRKLHVSSTLRGIAAFESQPVHPDLFWCGGAPVIDGYGMNTWLDMSIRYKDTPYYVLEPANQANPGIWHWPSLTT